MLTADHLLSRIFRYTTERLEEIRAVAQLAEGSDDDEEEEDELDAGDSQSIGEESIQAAYVYSFSSPSWIIN